MKKISSHRGVIHEYCHCWACLEERGDRGKGTCTRKREVHHCRSNFDDNALGILDTLSIIFVVVMRTPLIVSHVQGAL